MFCLDSHQRGKSERLTPALERQHRVCQRMRCEDPGVERRDGVRIYNPNMPEDIFLHSQFLLMQMSQPLGRLLNVTQATKHLPGNADVSTF